MSRIITRVYVTVIIVMGASVPVEALAFTFSTGNPDGLLGALSRPAGQGLLETETADDLAIAAENAFPILEYNVGFA